jgi:hypothetical protein
MSWRRGLFWLWIALSALWLVVSFPVSIWVWKDVMLLVGVTPDHPLPFDATPEGGTPIWVPLAIIFAPPVLLLALGSAGYWIVSRLGRRHNPER